MRSRSTSSARRRSSSARRRSPARPRICAGTRARSQPLVASAPPPSTARSASVTAVVPASNTAAAPTATVAASSATRAPRALRARRPGCLDWPIVPRIVEAAYARRSSAAYRKPVIRWPAFCRAQTPGASGGLDVHDLEADRPSRHRHLDRLALLVADEGAADRRLVREAGVGRIGLGRADDLVRVDVAVVDILHADARADRHHVGADVLRIDDPGGAKLLLEPRDAMLEQRLLVLGVVVLGVLGDVAELARLADAVGDLATLGRLEFLDLLLQLLVAL